MPCLSSRILLSDHSARHRLPGRMLGLQRPSIRPAWRRSVHLVTRCHRRVRVIERYVLGYRANTSPFELAGSAYKVIQCRGNHHRLVFGRQVRQIGERDIAAQSQRYGTDNLRDDLLRSAWWKKLPRILEDPPIPVGAKAQALRAERAGQLGGL